jgi:ribosomal protein S18 acetylase RimI-like enzyme
MPRLQCALLQAADTTAVIALLAAVFSTAEPPAVAMQLTREDLSQFVALLCPKALAEGLTIVARDVDSHQLVGVVLTDDFAAPPGLDPSSYSRKFLPIFALLESLDAQYRRGRSIDPGRYLHLFMLAVDARFAGQGISQQLVRECLSNGEAKGYTHAVTEATGVVSQHVFRKAGFVERCRRSYQEYRYEGGAVFASIREHEATILMDRGLGRTAVS